MRIYAIVLLLITSTTVWAQECTSTFSGTIIDLHDDTLLIGATVIMAGTEQAVLTNDDGRFMFNNICDGTYSFQVSHPFCATKGYTVKIEGNTTKNFKLEHHLEELNQVIITGNSKIETTKTVETQKLSSKALEQFSHASFGDALNSISGVSGLKTGTTVVKPVINGLHSSRVLTVNNGVIMEDQEWGTEHAPNIDVNTSGNIIVVKGASALQYGGDAIGGVIISEASKIPVKDTLHGKTIANLSTNGKSGALTSQLTKSFDNGIFVNLQGTLKKAGDFSAPNYVLSNTGARETNFAINAGLNKFNYGFEAYYSLFKNELGILRASHLGGAQDQVNALTSSVPLIINDFTYDINSPKQEVTHQLGRFKAFKRFKTLGKLTFQYDYQFNNRLEFDVRRGDRKDKASLDLDLKTHTFKFDLISKLFSSVNLKTGVIARYQDNFANPNTGVRRLIPDYESNHYGMYAVTDMKLKENWLIEAGARFDNTYINALKFYRESFWESRGYDVLFPEMVIKTESSQVLVNPKLSFNNISATLGSSYTFSDNYKVSINLALASRAPNPSELFSEGLHHSASRIELGDFRFQSEESHKLGVNFSRNNSDFSFNINPFINSINNFMIIEPVGVRQTIRGNFQVWEYRQTKAQLLGLDLDASYKFNSKWTYKHQLSMVKGYDKTLDNALINMPPVNTQNSIIYKNSNINNLRLELQSDLVFRQNEFPNNNFEVFIPVTQTNELVDISTPPEGYHLLNFNSAVDFKLSKNSILNLGIGVNNIFNSTYRNYLNRLRYFTDDLGRNFLLNIKINY